MNKKRKSRTELSKNVAWRSDLKDMFIIKVPVSFCFLCCNCCVCCCLNRGLKVKKSKKKENKTKE